MENKLLHAYEITQAGKRYQILLFFGSDLRIIANIGEIQKNHIQDMGEIIVRDLAGKPTLIPRSVLLEQMGNKYGGAKTVLFKKICRHRVMWQIFPRDTEFRKI